MNSSNVTSNSHPYVRADEYVNQLVQPVMLENGPTIYLPKKDEQQPLSPIPLETQSFPTSLEERSVSVETSTPEAGENQDINAEIIQNLKIIMVRLKKHELSYILETINNYYHTNSNDEDFYFNRLIKQQDTSSDVAFIQLILDKIDNKALTVDQYDALHKIIDKITKKNLVIGANTEIYNEIYKLVSYLAEFKPFYAVTSVLKLAEFIKDKHHFLAETHADKILETLYNTIKDPIKTKLAQNDYTLEFENYIAQSIAEILQQLTTPENHYQFINDWLEDDKLSKNFKKTVTAELKNRGLFINNEYSSAEQLSIVDEIEENTEVKTLLNNRSHLGFKKFVNKDYPLKEFINDLEKLDVAELINVLNLDFTNYVCKRNQDSNFFTKLFTNVDSDLCIQLVEVIYKKICKQDLNNNAYELLGNIVYRMHIAVSKNDDIPIRLYDKIYQLMHQVAKTNVTIPIVLLKSMIENKGQYKFNFLISSNRVYGSYLKLLAVIFEKQQDAETYDLYDEMHGYIINNIKSNKNYPSEYKKYMANNIFNIGKKLKDHEPREAYFKFWLKADSGISKTFQYLLRDLMIYTPFT